MVLRMACPTKRPGSDNWYFRRKIPADVQAILERLPKAQRPRNWYGAEIMISLRTADRAAAKARCPEVAADVEKQIAGLRAGPKPLSTKQIAALAGELYRGFSEGLEDNPVLSPEKWREVAKFNEAIRDGAAALPAEMFIGRIEGDQLRASAEKLLGPMVDAFLKERGIFTVEESRQKLIERFAAEAPEVAKKLARNADGDYTTDTYVKKFPPFEQTQAKSTPKKSLTALAEAWHKAAIARGVIQRDADRIKKRFEALIKFLGHDDVSRVVKLDIVRWKDHRLALGRSVKTINDSDITSFNNVFNWAVEREWLPSNPADGTTIKQKKRKAKLRDEYFSQEEAKAVLLHAASTVATPKEAPKTTAAKRWVPWLAKLTTSTNASRAECSQILSGARNVETTILREGRLRYRTQFCMRETALPFT